MKQLNDIEQRIADAIIDSADSDRFDFDIELDNGNSVNVRGEVLSNSYQETDAVCGYGNGTGAWVTTFVECDVTSATYDEDGHVVVDDGINDDAICEYVKQELLSA